MSRRMICGIRQERAAVGVVGAHHDPPGIVDHQVPFQPDRPLPGVDQARVLVFDRHDAATGLHSVSLLIPFRLVDLAQVIADRAVAGHAGGLAEDDLADVDRQVGVRIDILGQRRDPRRKRLFVAVAAAIAVELDVGQMPAMALQELHRLERGRPVAGQAEVVGVDVHRVRQPQLVDGLGDRLDDLPRRHSEVIDDRVDGLDVTGRPVLPHLDAARD